LERVRLERRAEADALREQEPLVWAPLRRLLEARQRLEARDSPGGERHERLEDRAQPILGLEQRNDLGALALGVLDGDLRRVIAARRSRTLALRHPQRALAGLHERRGVAGVGRVDRIARRRAQLE